MVECLVCTHETLSSIPSTGRVEKKSFGSVGTGQVTECLSSNCKALGLSPLYANARCTIRLGGA